MIIDNVLLDEVSSKARENERKRMNYNFHDTLDAKAQRLLNALEPGTEVPIHRHQHTSETYILLRGAIRVSFYDDSGVNTVNFDLSPVDGHYGVHIPKGQWHTLLVQEPSVIFEVKDGPYMPLTADDIMS